METQIRERQVQLKHRLDGLTRILQATSTLEERLNELPHAESELLDQRQAFENAGEIVRRVLDIRVIASLLLDAA